MEVTQQANKTGSVLYSLRHAAYFMVLLLLLAACTNDSTTTHQPTPTPGPTRTAPGPSIACSTHSSNPVTLNMYYGSEKQAWMTDVVKDFNSRSITACDGPITVNATPIGSGQSMQQIIDGQIQPDIWSPAGGVWLTLANNMWQQKHAGAQLIGTSASDSPSLVLSPVVIAMWKTQAEALGWPNKPIGWSDIATLSTNPLGWSAYGHAEFGDFKFGHTHPDYSNSGLDAIIAENYAAVGKTSGLTVDDVNNARTQDFVANVESSVIHYGDSTGFFADKMFNNGPGYLSATVMYESLVVEANDGKTYPKVGTSYPPVVAIYPKEGTFYSDHPFAILKASWVTEAKRTSSLAFRNFLLDAPQQQKALQYGFRPADLTIALAAPLDSTHGVDIKQPKTFLQIPSADVINAVKASWNQQRRKVDVMLILDRSGSMNDPIGGISKIDAAKEGLKEFVQQLGDSDGLGLTVFSDNTNVLTPVSALGSKRQNVLNQINGIVANGNTLLYDTIASQVQSLQALSSKHIKAIVILTDGQDTTSKLSVDQLVQQITPSGDNAGKGIKVFTIAYGSDADVAGLTKVANASGGQEYAGNPQNIKQVYIQISEFF